MTDSPTEAAVTDQSAARNRCSKAEVLNEMTTCFPALMSLLHSAAGPERRVTYRAHPIEGRQDHLFDLPDGRSYTCLRTPWEQPVPDCCCDTVTHTPVDQSRYDGAIERTMETFR